MWRYIAAATLVVGVGAAMYFLGLPILSAIGGQLSAIGGNMKVGSVTVNQELSEVIWGFVASIAVVFIGAVVYLFVASQADENDSGALTSGGGWR